MARGIKRVALEMTRPGSTDEAARLAVLRRYRILDTEPEAVFDALTRLAARICGTPSALITLVDADRQWFKSRVGFDAEQLPLDTGFCPVAIEQHEMLIIADTLADERFANNPVVTSPPHVRFYAGIPLITPEGAALGTLCVVDLEPRQLGSEQLTALDALGQEAMAQLERRRLTLIEADNPSWVLQGHDAQLRTITDAVPSLISYVDSDQRYRFNNKAYEDWFGRPPEQVYGQHLNQVLGERAYGAIRKHVEKALSGQRVSFEAEVPYRAWRKHARVPRSVS